MKTFIIFFATWILPFALPCTENANSNIGGKMLRVHYFPIGSQTLTPVTIDNIESRGRVMDLIADSDIEYVLKILLDHNTLDPLIDEFNDKAVRIKIIKIEGKAEDTMAIIDNFGMVKRVDGDRLLPQDTMKQLKDFFEGKIQILM